MVQLTETYPRWSVLRRLRRPCIQELAAAPLKTEPEAKPLGAWRAGEAIGILSWARFGSIFPTR